MSAALTAPAVERLERMLGRVLLAGVLAASACLTIGLILWMAGGYAVAAERTLAAGLIILMGTPMLRVVVSLIEYLRMRDWVFATATLVVLGVLLVTVALAMTQP